MSKSLGLALLGPAYKAPRIPVMDHIWGISRDAVRHFTGRDPLAEPDRVNEIYQQLTDVFEIDLLWGGGLPTRDSEMFDWDDAGPRVRRNKAGLDIVQWGLFYAVHQEDGRHFVHVPKPASVDAALAFEPLEFFPQTVEDYRRKFEADYANMLASCGNSAYPIPHHYTTCFHWPLAIFGFELLCEAGLEDDRFGDLMARFAEISRRITTAWSQVRHDGEKLRVFICHDDLTMTSGPIFSPDWYRRHIFPHYPGIFAPLRAAGIPIVFTSDGDCSAFVDDIFAAGASGLNFEYLVSLERLVSDYPDKILIGNINSATLGRGPIDAIEREVTRCLTIGARAPRYVANVGGGITHDIPVAHLEAYLKLRKRLCAELRG